MRSLLIDHSDDRCLEEKKKKKKKRNWQPINPYPQCYKRLEPSNSIKRVKARNIAKKYPDSLVHLKTFDNNYMTYFLHSIFIGKQLERGTESCGEILIEIEL